MSDTATEAAPAPAAASVSLDVSMLEKMARDIALLDEQIAGISGSEAAVRKSVVTRIQTENADQVKELTSRLVEQLGRLKQNPVLLVAVIESLGDVLGEEFQGYIDEVVGAEVKKVLDGSKGQVEPLKEQRKAALEQFKAMRTVLEQYKVDVSSVPVPTRARGRSGGSSGSTSQRTGMNPEQYRYHINGKPQPISQNTFSSTAFYATLGCVTSDDPATQAKLDEKPEKWGTQELRDFVAAQGVKVGKPGEGDDTWEVTLPNKTVVSARRLDKDLDKDIFDKVAEVEAAKNADGDDGDNDSSDNTEAPAPATA